jgi:hypothetical protein
VALARSRPVLSAIGLCLLVAVVSLLVSDQPTYDPTAWLIWGRQIAHGTLDTVAGPSWKPLPVLVTAPAALLGDGPAPLVWLAVARTGGLLALVAAAVLAGRLAGGSRGGAVAAGLIAALGLALANSFLSGVLRGNSEGLLVALVLGGALAVLEGHRHVAFGLGVAAALLRPEAWPLLALYTLWLLREDRSPRMLAAVAGSAVLVLVLWFVPERIGSGDFFRGASRAREAVSGSPAQADFPFGAVFTNGASALVYPVYAGAVFAVLDAWRRRRTAVLLLAAAATLWMLAVAVLAQNGFTGNLRYVIPPASMLCVLAGVGWVAVARWPLGRRAVAVVAVLALACVPGLVGAADGVADTMRDAAEDERVFDDLPRIIARAGGEDRVTACGRVYTGPFQTQAVAWRLHLHEQDVGLRPLEPGTILARAPLEIARDERFAEKERTKRWVLRQSC